MPKLLNPIQIFTKKSKICCALSKFPWVRGLKRQITVSTTRKGRQVVIHGFLTIIPVLESHILPCPSPGFRQRGEGRVFFASGFLALFFWFFACACAPLSLATGSYPPLHCNSLWFFSLGLGQG